MSDIPGLAPYVAPAVVVIGAVWKILSGLAANKERQIAFRLQADEDQRGLLSELTDIKTDVGTVKAQVIAANGTMRVVQQDIAMLKGTVYGKDAAK